MSDPSQVLFAQLLQAVQAAQNAESPGQSPSQSGSPAPPANPLRNAPTAAVATPRPATSVSQPPVTASASSAPAYSSPQPNVASDSGSASISATSSPRFSNSPIARDALVRPLLGMIPDVNSMTSEQRKRLIEQLAGAHMQPQTSQSFQVASGGQNTNVVSSTPSSTPVVLPASTSNATPVASPMPQLRPAFTPTSAPIRPAPAQQASLLSQYPQSMYPMLYHPYGLQMMPQIQVQALQQTAIQANAAAAASAAARGSPVPAQMRDKVMTNVRGTPSAVSPLPAQYTPLPAGYALQNALNSLVPKRMPSTPTTPLPSGGGPARRSRARPSKPVSVVSSPYSPTAALEPTYAELQNMAEIKRRITSALDADHRAILNPDITPFRSVEDAVDRLLPYHVYQYGEETTLNADIEAGVPDAGTLVARATALVDQFNEWRCTEQRPPLQSAVLADKLMVQIMGQDPGTMFTPDLTGS